MSKKKKIILPLVIVLMIAWIAVFRSGATKDDVEMSEEEVIPKVQVRVIEAQDEVRVPVLLSGKIKPKKYTLVKSLSSGYLQYIIPIGDEVRAGQELFRVYDEAVEANYYNALNGLITAQDNLREVEATIENSISQAELGVKSAEASLSLAKKSLESIRKTSEQSLEGATDSGRAAYASAYNAVEQAIRFLSSGNLEGYAFKNFTNYNSQARSDAVNQFGRVKGLYTEEIEKYRNREIDSEIKKLRNKEIRDDYDYDDGEIESDLAEMDTLIEEVKKLADLAYIDLNYCIGTIEVSQATIDGYKTQLSTLLVSLNAANASVKGVKNGIKTARIAGEAGIEAAEIQVEQAENSLENARASLELARSGAEQRKLGAQAQLNGAQSQFDGAKYQFDNLAVRARFSGVVISNLIEVGDQVSPGAAVVEMGDVGEVEIELEVGTREVRQLTLGEEVRIQVTSNKVQITNKKQETRNKEIKGTNDANYYVGQLVEIEPAALGASGKVKIKVEADNSNYQFVPGEVAEVALELKYEGVDMIVVPLDAVVVGQNQSYVWVVEEVVWVEKQKGEQDEDGGWMMENGRAELDGDTDGIVVSKRVVETGQVFGEMVGVVSGLSEGDRVVVGGGGFLSDGEVVEVEEILNPKS